MLFRDRIARGVYAQLLSEEFRQHGARLVAFNSRGDDSSDGELGDDILDVIATWERKKIGERMNRGKVRKAREGKIFVGPSPNYGYRFDEGRDAYLVDEEKMAVVRRIFGMVGSQGMTLNSVERAPKDEGILSPSGQRLWNKPSIPRLITDDVYLSRTFEEVAALVTPDVAEKDALYGVWWYGRARHVRSRQRVIGPDGKLRYRKVGK
jgi:site-specific DNA recombinase